MNTKHVIMIASSLILAGCQSTSAQKNDITSKSILTKHLLEAKSEHEVLSAFASVNNGKVFTSKLYDYAIIDPTFSGDFYRAMDRQCGGNQTEPKVVESHRIGILNNLVELERVNVKYAEKDSFSEYGYITDDLIGDIIQKADVKNEEQLGSILLGLRHGKVATESTLIEDMQKLISVASGDMLTNPQGTRTYACMSGEDIRYFTSVYGIWDASGSQKSSILMVTKPHALNEMVVDMFSNMEKHGEKYGAETYRYHWEGQSGYLREVNLKVSDYYSKLNAFIRVNNNSNKPIKINGKKLIENLVESGNQYMPVFSGRYNPSASGAGCKYLVEEDKFLLNPKAECYMNYQYEVPGLSAPQTNKIKVTLAGKTVVAEKQTKLEYLIEYKNLANYF
ncbi:hypothetical protein [Vibrio vulnificus]|uniref:hypothetical protein n=1 Tax=Vibrio vulnificus TaxID=672 RepID=UPI001A30B4EC|nr:hypothetical protein [Vibrio vulnificus]MCA0766297.1 hypothetical protein [Vibrio vulnificus]HAT8542843.1 hypothetical protein [Vibrio vulnificus]